MVFPLLFVAMWLLITTILSLVSGWFWLAAKFPNRPEEPLLRLGWHSLAERVSLRAPRRHHAHIWTVLP